MTKLESFIMELQYYLSKNECGDCNIIRKHSKKLDHLGDVSFPINISNWHQFLDINAIPKDSIIIFDYRNKGLSVSKQCDDLKEFSKNWSLIIDKILIISSNAHIFIKRSPLLLSNTLQEVLNSYPEYGTSKFLNKNYKIRNFKPEKNILSCDLTVLRLELLKNIVNNFIKRFSVTTEVEEFEIEITLSQKSLKKANILCSPVLNEKGLKTLMTAEELYKKRASDMRMMAQHKYGVQLKKHDSWENYFDKLGKACVVIEMLSNKVQKPINITLNNLQSANKGASFIFYNCARIAALLKEFEKRVQQNMYPELPKLVDVDFLSINQSEEWELFYVYILQYPSLAKSCIKDIENGTINPHYLVAFLSNLCSVFSAYYRRIRILTDPREHLFSVLYARIYLLKGIQYVFHHALSLMNIEPIKEM